MASNAQSSALPGSSSAACSNAASPALQAVQAPPSKALARGPFWTRLPALRTFSSSLGHSNSQVEGRPGTDSPAAPPIVLPDRVSATRILLSDTQACVQKLSARMDILGTRSEQSLKEVQLAREALDTGGEKAVSEIADVVYKCQAALTKTIESQGILLDKAINDIAKLNISNDALHKLYEMQSASVASLTQNMHAVTIAMQSIQGLHAQVVGTLAPIEPLVRSFPAYVDALKPALERIVIDALERMVPRLQMNTYAHPEHQTPRGIKRKRAFEDTSLQTKDTPVHRRSTMAPPSSITLLAQEPSSPLLNRERRQSVLATRRLHSHSSVPNKVASSITTFMEAADEATGLAVPSQAPAYRDSEQTPRRPSLAIVSASGASVQSNKRPRAGSSARIVDVSDMCDNAAESLANAVSETPRAAARSIFNRVPATTRITRSAVKANAYEREITPLRVPFGHLQPQPESGCPSASNGVGGVNKAIVDATLPSIGWNTAPNGVVKRKTGRPRSRLPGTTKRKGRGNKSIPPPVSDTTRLSVQETSTVQSSGVSVATSGSVSKPRSSTKAKASKTTSPKRKTTDKSDASLESVSSVHGPPNSPSTHAKSSPAVIESNECVPPRSSSATGLMNPTNPENTTSRPRTLISLIDASQESSSFLTGHMNGGKEDAAGLTAALAHIDRDINFDSCLDMVSAHQTITRDNEERGLEVGNLVTPRSFRGVDQWSSSAMNTLSRGRPKRLLFVNDDSSEIDLLDELFAE